MPPPKLNRSRRFAIGVYINCLTHRLQIGASGLQSGGSSNVIPRLTRNLLYYREIADQVRNDGARRERGFYAEGVVCG